jgi:hypothetical protein
VVGIVLESSRVHWVPSQAHVSLLMVAPRPPTRRICDLVESYAMLVARGHKGALIELDNDGHGVAVGDGVRDGVGVGDGEGVGLAIADGEGVGLAIADGVGVGVGETAASGWLSPQAAHTRIRRQSRPRCFRSSSACARW